LTGKVSSRIAFSAPLSAIKPMITRSKTIARLVV